MTERFSLEQELREGGAGVAEARELAQLAARLPELRQLPLVATPPGLKVGRRFARRRQAWARSRWALALAGTAAAAVLVTGGVIAAAQSAIPGEALYPVKLETERVAVRFAPGMHDEIMMRRADEVNELVVHNARPAQVDATLAAYERAVVSDGSGSYAARDYCAGMLKTAAGQADPATRAKIMSSLSRLKLDNT